MLVKRNNLGRDSLLMLDAILYVDRHSDESKKSMLANLDRKIDLRKEHIFNLDGHEFDAYLDRTEYLIDLRNLIDDSFDEENNRPKTPVRKNRRTV